MARRLLCALTLTAALASSFPAIAFAQSQGPASSKARELARSALAKSDHASVIAAFDAALLSLTSPTDRIFILKTVASLEERSGNAAAALERYTAAASALPSRDDSLLLDAARCALALNDPVAADSIVRTVLQSSFDEPTTLRARVYSAWIQLGAGNRREALSLIRSFASNPACADHAPALLFTLWWSDGDDAARSKLLSAWPQSFEAACARGEATVGPSSFWYLMNRNEEGVAAFARAGSSGLAEALKAEAPSVKTTDQKASDQKATTQSSSASSEGSGASGVAAGSGPWQQVGFFKNREYADELVERLKQRGFVPVIREVVRPSGTRYHTVLVPEDAGRTAGPRLKNAGFESYLVTE